MSLICRSLISDMSQVIFSPFGPHVCPFFCPSLLILILIKVLVCERLCLKEFFQNLEADLKNGNVLRMYEYMSETQTCFIGFDRTHRATIQVKVRGGLLNTPF